MIDASFLDADEEALVRRPRPFGWFAAGILAIGAGVGAIGYYVPLASAHTKLASTHEELAKKTSELDHALKQDRARLASTENRRADLQKFLDAGSNAERVAAARVEAVRAIAYAQLEGFVKAKLLEITTEPQSLRLSFVEKSLFRPLSAVPTPGAKSILCKAASSIAAESDWDVTLIVRGSVEEKKYWETVADKGSALAKIFEEGCKLSLDKLTVHLRGPTESDSSLHGGAIEIHLGPQQKKQFSPSEAPSEKAEGG